MADIHDQTEAQSQDENNAVTLDDIVGVVEDTQESGEATKASEESTQSDLPEKYQGKTNAELVQMLEENQRFTGRQSSEIGELRGIVDDFIRTQTAQPVSQAPEEKVDFFDNPEAATDSRIDNHPAIKQAQATAAEMKRATAVATLQARHPDLPQVLGDPKFMEWVNGSNTRKRLYDEADKQFNADSADELVTTWKERQAVAQQAKQVEEVSRKQQVKQASTGDVSSNGETSKKIYRRADIIKLMQTDRARYEALQPDIMQAYAEGRVR